MGAYGVIIREEGLRGLLAGASVTLSFSGPATGMYFWAYASIKEQVRLARKPRFWTHRPGCCSSK